MNELLLRLNRAVFNALGGYPHDDHIAIVLSGGVDSSTVACVAHLFDPQLPTFTGYYADAGFSELEYARLAGGPNHHEILITPADFVENFDLMLEHVRPPFQGMGTFGQFVVARRLAEHGVKVALSGEGSDELFGGYARLMIVAGEKPPAGYEDYRLPDGYPRDLEAALAYDFERLPDLLAVDDQCLTAWGIEARAPFTDPAVVEYGLALPAKERVAKRHLKAAVRGLVPDAILDRRDKMGFPAPLVAWANGPLRDFVGDRIGYVPDPARPWDRGWWYELLRERGQVAA